MKMVDILEKIITKFEQINRIPRCSGGEEKLRHWLADWADEHGFERRADEVGNLVVQIPPYKGYETSPMVALQGHMDMVCEKVPDATHDFSHDPITLVREGDWLSAGETSLGADNGIALAYAMVLAEETDLPHPPLELLFTVDEENGLVGARHLGANMLRSGYLINLDSELEGEFIIGCAGGVETVITLEAEDRKSPANLLPLSIAIGGLLGGHSGVDIHKHRANAIKLLVRVLRRLAMQMPIRLTEIKGGTRHNALARNAEARIAISADEATNVSDQVAEMAKTFQAEFGSDEPNLFCTSRILDRMPPQAISSADTTRIINLLMVLPHGVGRMSQINKGVVETSASLSIVAMSDGKVVITCSQRSSSPTRLLEITDSIHAAAELADAQVVDLNQYPPWPPEAHSLLVQKAKTVYQNLTGHTPGLAVIHAGLECAVIGQRFPGIQMISFGPTIESPHSPLERLRLPTVEPVWELLTELLAQMR